MNSYFISGMPHPAWAQVDGPGPDLEELLDREIESESNPAKKKGRLVFKWLMIRLEIRFRFAAFHT